MKNSKLNPRKTLAWLGILALAAATATAAPIKRGDIAANPAWLVHLDVDGLRPTSIGQFLLSQTDKPEAQAKLAAFQVMFGFDLRTQVHGVTLYGTGSKPEDGVLMVYADFDPDRLITLAKAAKDSQSVKSHGHVIYNWIDEKKKPKNGERPRVYAAIQGNRVIFGQRESTVAHALEVLDGSAPSLAGSQTFPQMGGPGDTNFLEAAARKFDLPDKGPNAAIFRLTKLGRLQVAGTPQRITATLTLEANDAEIAGQMATVLQGLMALVKLQKAQQPEVVKLADAVSLTQDGANVIARLSLPADQVTAILRAGAERKAAHKDRHGTDQDEK